MKPPLALLALFALSTCGGVGWNAGECYCPVDGGLIDPDQNPYCLSVEKRICGRVDAGDSGTPRGIVHPPAPSVP